MTLTINGKKVEVSNSLNASDLVNQLGYQDQRIALEVNESIIPRSNHKHFILSDGDKVEIIKAVGGG